MDENQQETVPASAEQVVTPEHDTEPSKTSPDAQDAAAFVATNPEDAKLAHALLTQALQEAGHLPTDPPPAEATGEHPAHPLLDSIEQHMKWLPAELQLGFRTMVAKVRQAL